VLLLQQWENNAIAGNAARFRKQSDSSGGGRATSPNSDPRAGDVARGRTEPGHLRQDPAAQHRLRTLTLHGTIFVGFSRERSRLDSHCSSAWPAAATGQRRADPCYEPLTGLLLRAIDVSTCRRSRRVGRGLNRASPRAVPGGAPRGGALAVLVVPGRRRTHPAHRRGTARFVQPHCSSSASIDRGAAAGRRRWPSRVTSGRGRDRRGPSRRARHRPRITWACTVVVAPTTRAGTLCQRRSRGHAASSCARFSSLRLMGSRRGTEPSRAGPRTSRRER